MDRIVHTYESIKASATKYITKISWKKGDRKSYHAAHKRGLLKDDWIVKHFNENNPQKIEKLKREKIRLAEKLLDEFERLNKVRFCSQCCSVISWYSFSPCPTGKFGLRVECKGCGKDNQKERYIRQDVKDKRAYWNMEARKRIRKHRV